MEQYGLTWGRSFDDPTAHTYLEATNERDAAREADAIVRVERPRVAELTRGAIVVQMYADGRGWRAA
jgi:hypothetical protein